MLTVQPFPEFLSALVGLLVLFAQWLSTSLLPATHPLMGISQVGRIALQQSLTRPQVAPTIHISTMGWKRLIILVTTTVWAEDFRPQPTDQ